MMINQKGFTLIEIAIVLLIVSILLGYTVAMFPAQQNLKHYRKANVDIQKIQNSLIAFAQVNGRLPCPDTDTDGLENPIVLTNTCTSFTGMIPSGTLGYSSNNINQNGNVVDPWGEPYRYHVSNVATLPPAVDLVTPNGVRNVGISNLIPSDLFICDDSATLGVDADCTVAGANSNLVAGNIAVVIFSSGKDRQTLPLNVLTISNVQAENWDADTVYVYSTLSDVVGSEFDDIIRWISPNILYSKMIEAGQLP